MRWLPAIKIMVMVAADSPLPGMAAAADTRWPAPPVAEMDRLATPALDVDRAATPVAVVLSSALAAAATTAADRSTYNAPVYDSCAGYGYGECPGYGVPIVGAVINSVLAVTAATTATAATEDFRQTCNIRQTCNMAAAFPVGSAAVFAYGRIESGPPVARSLSYQPVSTDAVARSRANFSGLSMRSNSASSWRARETRLFIVPTATSQIAAASS